MSTIENTDNKRDQQWQDEQDIRNMLERYSDTVNRRDWATYRSFWTNDAVWDLGEPINVRKEGIEDIMTEVQRAVNSMSFFVQMPHAIVVEVNGDQATTGTTLNEMGRALDGKSGMFILAMYTDNLIRQNGSWLFTRRTYKVFYFDGSAPQGKTFASNAG